MAIQGYPNKELNASINQLQLEVLISSYIEADRLWNGRNVSCHFDRLYIPVEGSGVITGGGETVTIVPGMAYLIPAGLPVDFHCPNYIKKYYFHLNLLKPDRYDLFFGFPKICQLPFPPEQLQQLKDHYYSSSFAGILAIKMQLHQILLSFQTAYGIAMQPVPIYSEHIAQTIAYIHQNLTLHLTAETLAKERFISRSFLSKLFRQEVGIPIGQYISDQLFIEARRRLDLSNSSICEISRDLGFGDACYFSRRFKQICGISPLQYRKKHRD